MLHTWNGLMETGDAAKPAGCAAVATFLRRHVGDPDAARSSCQAFYAVSGLAGGSEALARLDVARIFLIILRAQITDLLVVDDVFTALRAATASADRLPVFASAGDVVPVMMAALAQHAAAPRILMHVSVMCRHILASGNASLISEVTNVGVYNALLASMRLNFSDVDSMRAASGTLLKVLHFHPDDDDGASAAPLLDAGIARFFCDALGRCDMHPRATAIVATAISGFTSKFPSLCEPLIRAGVVEAMVAAAPRVAEDGLASHQLLTGFRALSATSREMLLAFADKRVCSDAVLPLMVQHVGYQHRVGDKGVADLALQTLKHMMEDHSDPPALAAQLLAAGGAKAIVATAKRLPRDGEHLKITAFALYLLAKLTCAPSCSRELAAPEVVEWLVAQSKRKDMVYMAALRMCEVFGGIASSPGGGLRRAVAARLGDHALSCLRETLAGDPTHFARDPLQVVACKLLARLLASPAEAARLLGSGLLAAVLQMMRQSPLITLAPVEPDNTAFPLAPSEGILTAGAGVLLAVLRAPGGAERLRSGSGVATLAAVLALLAKQARVMGEEDDAAAVYEYEAAACAVARTLRKLDAAPPSVLSATKVGGSPAPVLLLEALRSFPSSAQLFADACTTLSRLADEPAHAKALLEADAATIVTGGTTRFLTLASAVPADAAAVSERDDFSRAAACAGMLALRSLAAADPRCVMRAVAATASAASADAAASLCARDASFAIACCGLTRNLAAVPEHRGALLSAGCMSSATAALRAHAGRADVAFAAAGALLALACDPANVPALVGAGAGALASEAIGHVGADTDVAWALCGLLYKLASAAEAAGNTASLGQLQAEGAGSLLTRALQLHSSSSRVVAAACSAIASLGSSRSGITALVAAGALAAVTAAAAVVAADAAASSDSSTRMARRASAKALAVFSVCM